MITGSNELELDSLFPIFYIQLLSAACFERQPHLLIVVSASNCRWVDGSFEHVVWASTYHWPRFVEAKTSHAAC